MGKIKEGDLVKIEWNDIVSECKWCPLSEVQKVKPALIVDVGILIKKTKKKVIISNSMSDDSQCSYTVFPRKVIKKIRKLKWQQKKR